MTEQEILVYLKSVNFDKQLKKLNKIKNKKVLFYGAGEFFEVVKNNYDLSSLNAVGICDRRFYPEQEGQDFLGYKIIPFEKLNDYDFNLVLVSTLKYLPVLDSLEKTFKGKKIKTEPLVNKPFVTILKEIFG